jgi:hypothetical protein
MDDEVRGFQILASQSSADVEVRCEGSWNCVRCGAIGRVTVDQEGRARCKCGRAIEISGVLRRAIAHNDLSKEKKLLAESVLANLKRA